MNQHDLVQKQDLGEILEKEKTGLREMVVTIMITETVETEIVMEQITEIAMK